LNVDLAAPKITRTAGPTNVGSTVQYSYQIEWCPQKSHIGSYSMGVQVFDNGDLDVQGNLAVPKGGYAPLYIKVVAPVFLISPQMNSTGTVTLKSVRQTAANITAFPFRYQVIAKNSKGNPLSYSILSSPRACGLPNGVCIDAATGLVTWLPAASDITDGNEATNKKIVVQARDTVTGETASGTISLWVQDPTAYPGEQGPSILSEAPSTSTNAVATRNGQPAVHDHRDGRQR
ncbi:MAG: hypothetical protein HC902_11105, partial [Calothrix sp. SM1_5_4]|nr:hypothetical protein [Calothrix sp. SM1_5_4]